MTLIEITPLQLLWSLLFVLVAALASLFYRLRLERDLLIGTVRTFAQLILVGYVLKFVFRLEHPLLVLLLYLWMIFWAAHSIRGRVAEREVRFFGPTFAAMVVSYMLVAVLVTAGLVQVEPWYQPQYFIPLGGMIVGNSMNAIAIALERLFADLRQQRPQIEMMLSLGASYREATVEIRRGVLRAGMIPSINALMTVGLVSLPGMMTGQILAGIDPLLAVRYQILVMLMLVGSTAIGTLIVVAIILRRCFTRAQQLRF